MAELRRIVDTCHRHGIRVIPYTSCKELHPHAPAWAHQAEWGRQRGAVYEPAHNYTGNGTFGAVMCMRSGWAAFRRQADELMLDDLPWDGLYFDWTSPLYCGHPGHADGRWHSDVDEFLDYMLWCRRRVGEDGLIVSHLTSVPSMIVENLSDLVFVGEHDAPCRPEAFSPEHRYLPIAPRSNVSPTDASGQRLKILSTLLEGYPPYHGFQDDAEAEDGVVTLSREAGRFRGLDLTGFRFLPASRRPFDTGHDDVFAALWFDRDAAVVYLANLGDVPATGRLRWNATTPVPKSVTLREADATGDVVADGIPYTLAAWDAAVFRLARPAMAVEAESGV